VVVIDLRGEVEGWAASWSRWMNRSEGVSWSGYVDRKALDTEYQREPERLFQYLAEAVPVAALLPDEDGDAGWALRTLRANGIALFYLPAQRWILGWEVATGVWATRACRAYSREDPTNEFQPFEWLGAFEDAREAISCG
jgi:hypothetical protein